MELDFNKICRVCMNEGVLMPIFKVHISKKMMACASVQVNKNKMQLRIPQSVYEKAVVYYLLAFKRLLCKDHKNIMTILFMFSDLYLSEWPNLSLYR